MQNMVLQVMQNDSLARQLLRDYNYNRGLVAEKYLDEDLLTLDQGSGVREDKMAEVIGVSFMPCRLSFGSS